MKKVEAVKKPKKKEVKFISSGVSAHPN